MRASGTIAPSRNGLERGFTLIELLVALTLFGMIGVALAGGIHFGTRVWESGKRETEESGEIQRAQQLIRRLLSQSMELRDRALDESEPPAFEGTTDRLFFTAPWLTGLSHAGLHYIEIAGGEDVDGTPSLNVRWHDRQAAQEGFNPGEEEDRSLVRAVDAIRFEYFGRAGDDREASWHDRWDPADGIPIGVALDLTLIGGDRGTWPRLVVAVKTGGTELAGENLQ